MITLKEQEILEEIYKGSRRTQMDIQTVMGKVYNDELALDLNRQAVDYARMQERAEDVLLEAGIIPESAGILEKTRRWATLSMSTALNISTHHIASLIRETERESFDRVGKAMEKTGIHTSKAYELGEEFCRLEKQNMQVLNAYRM